MSSKTDALFCTCYVLRAWLFVFSIGWTAMAMATNEDDAALRQASYAGDLQTVHALLAKGADVNAKAPKLGNTALMLAAMNGNRELSELLLANGADVNAKSSNGYTALIFAALNGHGDVVELLLAKGADINAKNDFGATAMMIASGNGNHNVEALLKRAGAKESGIAKPSTQALSTPEINYTNSAQEDFAAGDAAYKLGNYGNAAPFYRKAADQGHALAQFSIGLMYDIGQGVQQDYTQALSWYIKAAERGNAKAQNNLGFMYSEGKGVTQNYITAHMWFNISGMRGYQDGKKNRTFVEKLMNPSQIAEAQQQAAEWINKHR